MTVVDAKAKASVMAGVYTASSLLDTVRKQASAGPSNDIVPVGLFSTNMSIEQQVRYEHG